MAPQPTQVVKFVGKTFIYTTGIICVLLAIAWGLNSTTLRRMFGLLDNNRRNTIAMLNLVVSMVFAGSLSSVIMSASEQTVEIIPPLTSFYFLLVSMVYLFGFFGIQFLMDEFDMLKNMHQPLQMSLKWKFGAIIDTLPNGIFDNVVSHLDFESSLRFATCSKILNSLVSKSHQESRSFHSGNMTPLSDRMLGNAIQKHRPFDTAWALKSIYIQGSYYITDIGLSNALTLLPRNQLIDLDVSGCFKIGKDTLKYLADYQPESLISLALDRCQLISANDFGYLFSRCSNITRLSLRDTILDGASFLKLQDQKLRYLDISECLHIDEVSGCLALSRMSNLVLLLASSCTFSDNIFPHIPRGILNLDLSGWNVTDIGLKMFFSNSPNLCEVRMNGCTCISDETLYIMGSICKRIRTLEIARSRVSINGIKRIAENSRMMKHINLANCDKIDDSVCEYIYGSFPELKFLNVSGCLGVKDDCLERLYKEKPDVYLMYEYSEFFSKKMATEKLGLAKNAMARLFAGQGAGIAMVVLWSQTQNLFLTNEL